MPQQRTTNRQLKKQVYGYLSDDDFDRGLNHILGIPPRQAVGPLFTHFYHAQELVRWRAVTAMGAVVSGMVDAGDRESARNVMRRFMWNLNDESGGIGWGSPEAMGEVTARNEKMAHEFNRILVSYINEDGNFLEHEVLQRGSIWGVGRLAHARPELIPYAAPHLAGFLTSPDPYHRGLASWAAGPIADGPTKTLIKALSDDNSEIVVFLDGRLVTHTVSELADEALCSA